MAQDNDKLKNLDQAMQSAAMTEKKTKKATGQQKRAIITFPIEWEERILAESKASGLFFSMTAFIRQAMLEKMERDGI